MTAKMFITYAHKDGPASNRFRQYIDDPLPPWAVDVREEAATPTPRTDAPLRLKLRDTGLYDDLGGLGQRIWTTAGQGYAKTEFVEAWALEQTQRELAAAQERCKVMENWATQEAALRDAAEARAENWHKVADSRSAGLIKQMARAEASEKLLAECLTTLDHARVFIETREKMHEIGRELYDQLRSQIRAAIAEGEK